LDRRYNEALEALREAVRLDTTSVKAWVTLALTHYRLREYSECLGAADEALKCDPENKNAWNYRGIALLCLGRPAEALMQLIHAANLLQSAPAFALNVGAALAYLRRYEDALTWNDRAVTLWDSYWQAAINRADALIELVSYAEAEAQLDAATEATTGHSGYWAAKGSLHTRRGEYDEALVAIKRAIDLSDDDDDTAMAYQRMGELLIALEDYPKALKFAEHGLEIRPHDFCLQELKATALRGLGREGEANEIERAVQARLAEQLALLDQAGFTDG
jgi:tetratricopeptide (TPR) repeat protein